MKGRNESKSTPNPSATSAGNNMAMDSEHSATFTAWARRVSARWAVILAAGLIVLATMAAYSRSFTGVWVYDDVPAIVENPTIRQLWPIWKPLCPPNANGETVGGRPVLNLSLAVNYWISGDKVWSYHVANLAIHLVGALLLFGILRRTFLLPTMRDRWGAAALPLAFVAALLWAIHPLQTESVTYIVQRRVVDGPLLPPHAVLFHPRCEFGESKLLAHGAVLACLAGMATKEVMISAPLIVLLYDRTFCAGSFRKAWRRRYGFYLALAGTWLLLGWLVISTGGNRGGSAGFGSSVGSAAYLGTQFGAIVHYLRLCVWPHPLVFHYGRTTAQGMPATVPSAVVVGLLGLATVVALWRWPKVGFLGAWFFAILAPTSSVIPVATQIVAEHRMYLPSVAVVTGLAAGGWVLGRWLVRRGTIPLPALQATGGLLVMFASIAFGSLTFQRNVDYQSALAIWQEHGGQGARQ